MSKGRVLVAMSGGVDSSVTAYLLKQQGYECVGVTMRLTCPAPDPATGISKVDRDIADAKAVAARIGIPHRVLDLQETFEKSVIDRFVTAYQTGLTPNPCIICNRRIKFGALRRRPQKGPELLSLFAHPRAPGSHDLSAGGHE